MRDRFSDSHKRLDGGRTWWAHFAFTRINIAPTILPKKIEDLRDVNASTSSFKGLRVIDWSADVAESSRREMRDGPRQRLRAESLWPQPPSTLSKDFRRIDA